MALSDQVYWKIHDIHSGMFPNAETAASSYNNDGCKLAEGVMMRADDVFDERCRDSLFEESL